MEQDQLPPELQAYAGRLSRHIEGAYHATGNRLGWRFLYSPASVLLDAEVAFIGLNPGGNELPNDHAGFSMEAGSAYCVEAWRKGCPPGESPLQLQVRALFTMLNVEPEKVLAGNFVPFQSRNWSELANTDDALAFSRDLWANVLARAKPRLIITMGGRSRDELAALLGISHLEYMPTGWGNVTAARGEGEAATLIALPHLSRFGIIRRPASASHMKRLFDGFI